MFIHTLFKIVIFMREEDVGVIDEEAVLKWKI